MTFAGTKCARNINKYKKKNMDLFVLLLVQFKISPKTDIFYTFNADKIVLHQSIKTFYEIINGIKTIKFFISESLFRAAALPPSYFF